MVRNPMTPSLLSYPRCDCHSCTQARILDFHIAADPRLSGLQIPKGNPEKKECDHPFAALWAKKLKEEGILECSMCDARLYVPIKSSVPDEAVEDRIREFKHRAEHYWFGKQKRLCVTEEELRELVKLARRQK